MVIMQPNQQVPTTPPPYTPENSDYPPSQVSNVPEFLHLDPVQINKPKKSNKKLFILFVFCVTLCGIAAAGYWFYEQSKPDTLFYAAVSNAMSTKVAKREIKDEASTASGPLLATIESDFSDNKNAKSHIQYSYEPPKTPSGNTKNNISMKGEIVSKDDKSFQGRILNLSQNKLAGVSINRWYEVEMSNYKGNAIFDTFHLQKELKLLAPGLPFGNLSPDERGAVVDYMKASQIFKITHVQETSYENTPVKVMTLEAKSGDVAGFTKKMNEVFKMSLPGTSLPTDTVGSLKVWIDATSSRFIKVTSVPDSDKDNLAFHDETAISYPSSSTLPDVSAEKFAFLPPSRQLR